MTVTPDPSAAAQDGEAPSPAAAVAAEDATPVAALLAPTEVFGVAPPPGVLDPPELHPATETARAAITPHAARPYRRFINVPQSGATSAGRWNLPESSGKS
jgi:hypothetical protein